MMVYGDRAWDCLPRLPNPSVDRLPHHACGTRRRRKSWAHLAVREAHGLSWEKVDLVGWQRSKLSKPYIHRWRVLSCIYFTLCLCGGVTVPEQIPSYCRWFMWYTSVQHEICWSWLCSHWIGAILETCCEHVARIVIATKEPEWQCSQSNWCHTESATTWTNVASTRHFGEFQDQQYMPSWEIFQ